MPAMDQSGTEDLSRLRAIAEEGRAAPLLGGWHLILWGGAVGLALLINWAVAARLLPWPGWSLAISWFGIAGLAWAASFAIGRHRFDSRGAHTVGNRVERAVWIAAGYFLMVLALALLAHGLLSADPTAWELYALMPPVAFGAYAIALEASAVAAGNGSMRPNVLLSLAFAAATTLLIGEAEQSLVAAAGIALVAIPTGVRQLRDERRTA